MATLGSSVSSGSDVFIVSGATETSAALSFSSLLATGTVADIKVKIVIDTGSAVTAVSGQLWRDCLHERVKQPLREPPQQCLWGATQEVQPLGAVDLEIGLGGYSGQITTLVIEKLPCPVLVGTDYLVIAKAKIDLASGTLIMDGGHTVPCHMHLNNSLKIVEDVYLPPLHEAALVVSVEGPNVKDRTGLVSRDPQFSQKAGIWLAKGVATVTAESTITVMLANFSRKAQYLKKGWYVGIFQLDYTATILLIHPVSLAKSQVKKETTDSLDIVWQETLKEVDFSETALNKEQQRELIDILAKNRDLFAVNPKSPGTTTVVEHHIDTQGHPPINQPPYRQSFANAAICTKEVRMMLENDIIRPSSSPWASPIVLVTKKDGSIRFCVDYRKLNAITKGDVYPLPRIDETLDSISDAKWFSTMDLAAGY
jgi:hypothetical protein